MESICTTIYASVRLLRQARFAPDGPERAVECLTPLEIAIGLIATCDAAIYAMQPALPDGLKSSPV